MLFRSSHDSGWFPSHDKVGGFGEKELLDGEPSYAKATEGSGASLGGASRACQAAEPAAGPIKADLGDLA